MKRMIAIAVALLPIASFAQVRDTLVVENATSVQVISSPSSLSVKIDGTAEKPDFRYSASMAAGEEETVRSESHERADRLDFDTPFTRKKVNPHWVVSFFPCEEVAWGNVLGASDFFGSCPTDVFVGDIGLFDLRFYPGRGNHYLSTGFHFGFQNISVQGGNRFLSQKDGMICFADYPAGVTPIGKTSDLFLLRYSFPLQYSYVFGKNAGWRFSAGAELHGNLVNYLNFRYAQDGNEVSTMIQNIHPRRFTVDLMTSLSYRGLGLRLRYNPVPAFSSAHGPEFRTWCIGAIVEF